MYWPAIANFCGFEIPRIFKHQFFDCIGPFRDHHIDGNAFMTLDMPTLKYLDISDKSARNLSTIVASIAIAKPVKHEYGRESLISKFFSAIIHKSKKSNVNRKRVKSTELPSAISEYDRNSISSAPGEVLELSNSETNSLYEEIDQPDVEAIEVDSQLYDQLVYKYPEASLDGPIQLEIDESDLEQNVIIRSNKGHDAKIRLSTMDNTKDEDAHIYSQIPQEYERMSLKPKSYQDDYLYVVGNEDVKATQNLNKAQSNTYENHSVQALQNLSAKISPATGYLKQETGKTAGGERKKNQIFNEVIKPSKEAPRRLKKKATVIIKRMQKYEQQVDENKSNLATAQAKSMAGSLHNSPPARKTRQLTEQVDSKLVKPLRQQLTGQLEKRSSEKSDDAIFTDTSKSKANPTFEKGQSNLNKKTLPEVDPGHHNVASSPFILKDQRFVNQNYPSRDEKVPKQTNQGLELLKNAKSAISPSSALDNVIKAKRS
ncbi:uncharacterized protein TRIADDRAFT_58656 [Trichoplax adhaerens]|uniref:SAM domain-containing protein n=1 Tax=Trichoplax adhaerens TaxID=10228 RepID=B3S3B1_TRIAD|nr:predicted protein [Trichoplax adhaerens]EDV22760.1 predicted protein [Trichoplax adhaerens]|eukprot:XP_002114626.1 predicted protein [Trichoplax adhaerens]